MVGGDLRHTIKKVANDPFRRAMAKDVRGDGGEKRNRGNRKEEGYR